jgi:lysozyme family protein
MNKFESALRLILDWEGGYSNDPNDPGGETKFGISKRAFPHINIKALTLDGAKAIYREHYWDKCHCEELPRALAIIVFDCAVNQGTDFAARNLQGVVGADVDGVIGKKTVAAAQLKDIDRTVREYIVNRIMRYTQTEGWQVYGKGWVKRVVDIHQHCFVREAQ